MVLKIAKIHTNASNPHDAVEYLDPIKDYTPLTDKRWITFLKLDENGVPHIGLRFVKGDDDKSYYIEYTDEEDVEGFTYYTNNHLDLYWQGFMKDMFNNMSLMLGGHTVDRHDLYRDVMEFQI